MYVRNLTFHYENERCIGMASGRACVYLSTAGSYIGQDDWGRDYIFAVMRALGIEKHTSVIAEGLDLYGADADEIMRSAIQRTVDCAEETLTLLENGG